MIFVYLVPVALIVGISIIYLKFKPSSKTARWIIVIGSAIITVLILPLIIFVGSLTYWELVQAPIEREQYQKDYKWAREVVDALTKFYLDTGYYPEQLSDLVPDYLNDLPPEPYTGQPYYYQLDEDGEFTFIFYGWNGMVGLNMACYSRNSDVQCRFFD